MGRFLENCVKLSFSPVTLNMTIKLLIISVKQILSFIFYVSVTVSKLTLNVYNVLPNHSLVKYLTCPGVFLPLI